MATFEVEYKMVLSGSVQVEAKNHVEALHTFRDHSYSKLREYAENDGDIDIAPGDGSTPSGPPRLQGDKNGEQQQEEAQGI